MEQKLPQLPGSQVIKLPNHVGWKWQSRGHTYIRMYMPAEVAYFQATWRSALSVHNYDTVMREYDVIERCMCHDNGC